MESVELLIPPRFCGPPDTGNGGFTAGMLAALTSLPGAVRVTLRQPPPLDVPMAVTADGDGHLASFGGAVIATAEPGSLVADHVPPVPFETARAAEAGYAGLVGHPFPGCFVCGPQRPRGDGLGLRPGPVGDQGPDGDGWVASTWVPDATLAKDGQLDRWMVWAALDCPGGWSSDLVDRPMVLGRITAAVDAVPEVGDRCVVVGRRLEVAGRKTLTASTAYDPDGRVLGHAESTWIAV